MPNELERDLFSMYDNYDDEQEFLTYVKEMNEFSEKVKHIACPKCDFKTLEPIGLHEAQCYNCNHKINLDNHDK